MQYLADRLRKRTSVGIGQGLRCAAQLLRRLNNHTDTPSITIGGNA
ncbi:hypothetical protein FHR47_003188 [Xanthomonas arboricola]|nr:hypothetical protein [Xanthomonas cannabis]